MKLLYLLRHVSWLLLLIGLIGVSAQEDTCGFNCQTAYQLIDVGVQAYRSGDSASALLYLNDAEKLLDSDDITPRSALLYSIRGDIYRERELFTRAMEDYGNSLVRRETPDAFAGRGWIHYATSEYEMAYRDFTSAMRLEPRNGIYHNMRGLIQLQLEQYKRAVDDFGRALRLAPADAATYIFYKNRADAYLRMGDSSRAMVDYNLAIAENPYYTNAYLARAAITFDQKRYDVARNDCLRVLQMEPANVYALLNDGIVLFQLNRVPEALARVEEVLILQPDFARAQYWHGVLSFIQGNYSAAETSFAVAAELTPNFADIFFDRGLTYLAQNKYEAALADFSQYVTFIPGSAASYYYRGQAHYALGSYTEALVDYTEAIRLSPIMAEAYAGRALIYERLSQAEKAANDLAKSQTLQPFFKEPYVYNEQTFYINARLQGLFLPSEADIQVDLKAATQLAAAGSDFLEQDRFIPAIAAYTDALTINPRLIPVYLGRGDAYVAIGRVQNGISDYTRVLDMQPENAAALRGRGDAYVALGDTEEAAEDYRAYETITGRLEPGMEAIINRS